MQQIPVGAVNFNHAKASLDRALRRGNKRGHDFLNARFIERVRQWIVLSKRNRTGRDHFPSALLRCFQSMPAEPRGGATCLTASMRELNARNGAHALHE